MSPLDWPLRSTTQMTEIDVRALSDSIGPSPCPCQDVHRLMTGEIVRDDDVAAVFKVLLANHEGDSRLWWLIGSGPWWPERCERRTGVSVETVFVDAGFSSRLVDAAESPWRGDPLFSAPTFAHHLDRSEALGHEQAAKWVFRMIDFLIDHLDGPRAFLLNAFHHAPAFLCGHVFDKTKPVLLVCHQDTGWQLVCGDVHDDQPRLVGLSHVVAADASLAAILDLPLGFEAERSVVGGSWARRPSTDDS
jgi:hypothetical protein